MDPSGSCEGGSTRRTLLTTLGVGATTIPLAGCSEDTDNESPAVTPTQSPDSTPTETLKTEEDDLSWEEISNVQIETDDEVTRALAVEFDEVIIEDVNVQSAIQKAIDGVGFGGTVEIMAGTYYIEDSPLRISEGVTLLGQGPGETVFKLPNGVHQDAHSILEVTSGADDVTIRDLEIDGNEANNRDIEPFPDSPHSHGLLIHESRDGVKPKRTTVENIYIHDTIRSNIVLAGIDCTIDTAKLANSATDHWLYLARAEQCSVNNIRASGFAREGIVFSTSGHKAVDNTISDLVIEDAKRTPFDEAVGRENLDAIAPLGPIVFRPDGEGRGNIIRDVEIRPPEDDISHMVRVNQPDAKIEGLTITGPVGYTHAVISAGNSTTFDSLAGTTISGVTLNVESSGDRDFNTALFDISRSDIVIEDVTVNQKVDDFFGFRIAARHGPISDCEIRNVDMRSGREAVFVDGNEYAVTNLAIGDFRDHLDSGVNTQGDVEFDTKTIE